MPVPLRGGSWLGCGVVPAMGALFNLEAGCQKWKPLDIPGTQPPLSDAIMRPYVPLGTKRIGEGDWIFINYFILF